MLNKCTFIGRVGKDPEIKSTNSGEQLAYFSLACTEKWTSKTGEKKEATEWVNVVVWGKLCTVIQNYVKKGSKLYISGKLKTRSWEDQSGQTKYMTEVVLQGFGGELIMLDSKGGGGQQDSYAKPESARKQLFGSNIDTDLDDEIPFVRW